jgi:hypothetical protein
MVFYINLLLQQKGGIENMEKESMSDHETYVPKCIYATMQWKRAL